MSIKLEVRDVEAVTIEGFPNHIIGRASILKKDEKMCKECTSSRTETKVFTASRCILCGAEVMTESPGQTCTGWSKF